MLVILQTVKDSGTQNERDFADNWATGVRACTPGYENDIGAISVCLGTKMSPPRLAKEPAATGFRI